MYNEIEYWTKRKFVKQSPEDVKDFIILNIQDCQSILDFGAGNGRLFELYKDKDVVAYDIVKRQYPIQGLRSFRFTNEYEDKIYDCVICSMVLLHIRPENLKKILDYLFKVGRKVLIVTFYNPKIN